jgi:hypothetical protein
MGEDEAKLIMDKGRKRLFAIMIAILAAPLKDYRAVVGDLLVVSRLSSTLPAPSFVFFAD